MRDETCSALQQENVPLNDEIQRLSKEIADSQGRLQGLRNMARKIESYHAQIEQYRQRDIAKEIQIIERWAKLRTSQGLIWRICDALPIEAVAELGGGKCRKARRS